MARKRANQFEEEEEETTATAPGDALDTETEQPSIEERLTAIEESLAEIKGLLSPQGQAEKERNAQMERNRKVPYIAPELPAGLSPNEKINHPMVTAQAANPTEAIAPMESETDPAQID